MKKGFIVSTVILAFLSILYACSNKSTNKDQRCPALVEKAEFFNAKCANGTKEGPMGIRMSVEYVDSGSERHGYQQMVDYRVTFEHVVKSKKTGDVIVRNTMTPDEIAEALEKQLTPLDELKMNVTTQKGTLPRGMEAGYTMNDISCSDGIVNIEIIIDENMKDFDDATKLKAWSKAEQAVTLADQTTGLTFWSVAAQVPAEFNFHFVGSKGNNDLHIRFSKDEVVTFNEVMKRIKDQQFK